jgi:hypothetical protein
MFDIETFKNSGGAKLKRIMDIPDKIDMQDY